jgi:hypothetical protein
MEVKRQKDLLIMHGEYHYEENKKSFFRNSH